MPFATWPRRCVARDTDMTDNEIETFREAFTADAVEYNGRMFIAREKVLEYLNGAELRVTRLKLDDDNGTPF